MADYGTDYQTLQLEVLRLELRGRLAQIAALNSASSRFLVRRRAAAAQRRACRRRRRGPPAAGRATRPSPLAPP